jgi:tryptophan synthase alpha chain
MISRRFTLDDPSAAPYLAAYFPLGDPLVPLERLAAYLAAGVDVVELGLRTSDPYADGPVIGASMQRSTGTGTLADTVAAMGVLRRSGRAVMGMVFAYASPDLAADAAWSDVDALLCLGKGGLRDRIETAAVAGRARLTTFVPYDLPAADVERAIHATGFVFLHYTPGPTGLRDTTDPALPRRLARLRAAGVTAPILAGIGISTPEQARHAVDAGANGVVIGSKTVQKAMEGQAALEDYLNEMRAVVNGG